MNYLTVTPYGNRLSANTGKMLAEWERQKKKLDALESELRAELMLEMESRNIVKAESDEVVITYIAPTEKETFDTKAFRAEHPDIYMQYAKYSPVKASVRIKVKENAD